jgi:hypothetical protein
MYTNIAIYQIVGNLLSQMVILVQSTRSTCQLPRRFVPCVVGRSKDIREVEDAMYHPNQRLEEL